MKPQNHKKGTNQLSGTEKEQCVYWTCPEQAKYWGKIRQHSMSVYYKAYHRCDWTQRHCPWSCSLSLGYRLQTWTSETGLASCHWSHLGSHWRWSRSHQSSHCPGPTVLEVLLWSNTDTAGFKVLYCTFGTVLSELHISSFFQHIWLQ